MAKNSDKVKKTIVQGNLTLSVFPSSLEDRDLLNQFVNELYNLGEKYFPKTFSLEMIVGYSKNNHDLFLSEIV